MSAEPTWSKPTFSAILIGGRVWDLPALQRGAGLRWALPLAVCGGSIGRPADETAAAPPHRARNLRGLRAPTGETANTVRSDAYLRSGTRGNESLACCRLACCQTMKVLGIVLSRLRPLFGLPPRDGRRQDSAGVPSKRTRGETQTGKRQPRERSTGRLTS